MKSPLPPKGGRFVLPPLAAALAMVGIGSHASAQNLAPLAEYNVIVRGNLSTNSDIEGRTSVGGNLISSQSANFGTRLQNQVPSGDLVLRVQGNIVSGNPLQLNAGSLEIGGTTHGRIINYNGGGSLVSSPGANYSQTFSDLTLASQELATYSGNSNALLVANIPEQPGPLKLTANPDSSGLAVFQVHAKDVFGNHLAQQIELVTNNAADILINVAGQVINWNAGNLVGDLTQSYWRERVIWELPRGHHH